MGSHPLLLVTPSVQVCGAVPGVCGGSTGARRPCHPARTPLAAALDTHLTSGRSTSSRSSSCASVARSAAANSWCNSPSKRSKSCSAAGCWDSRRSSVSRSLRIWSRWLLLLVAPSVPVCDSGGPLLWGPLWERGFLDIPTLYPEGMLSIFPRLTDHHELHHRKRCSTGARRTTTLRVTNCHRRASNVSWGHVRPPPIAQFETYTQKSRRCTGPAWRRSPARAPPARRRPAAPAP